MYCQECGKKIDDDAAFCRFCGKSVVNDGISNNVIVSESENKNGNGNKSLINLAKKIGIAVIIVLIVIVLKLSSGGSKSEVIDAVESTTMEEIAMPEETAKTSALDDIIGDWAKCAKMYSNYNQPYYLRVEGEGVTAISDMSDDHYKLKLRKYYAVGVDDITVEEIDGIKYYTYSAEMYSSTAGVQKIGISLSLNEETGELICEYNTPESGVWEEVIRYEPLDSIEEDMRKHGNYEE